MTALPIRNCINSGFVDSNTLIQSGLLCNLLQALTTGSMSRFENHEQTESISLKWKDMIASCIFIIFHGTHTNQEEIKKLLDTKLHLVQDLNSHIQQILSPEKNGSSNFASLSPAWSLNGLNDKDTGKTMSLFSLIMSLQLGFISAMDQNVYRIDRKDGKESNVNELNPLRNPSFLKELHEKIYNSPAWGHSEFQGITLLSWTNYLTRNKSSIAGGVNAACDLTESVGTHIEDLLQTILQLGTFSFMSDILMKTNAEALDRVSFVHLYYAGINPCLLMNMLLIMLGIRYVYSCSTFLDPL